jgi:hypothetical protein
MKARGSISPRTKKRRGVIKAISILTNIMRCSRLPVSPLAHSWKESTESDEQNLGMSLQSSNAHRFKIKDRFATNNKGGSGRAGGLLEDAMSHLSWR